MLRGIGITAFACLAALASPMLHGQALPTASKGADLQVGATGVYVHPDYGSAWFKGFGIYSTLDSRSHLGLMLDFHQSNGPNRTVERTYEAGARYVLHSNRFHPYAKLMIGRGVFGFPAYPNAPDVSGGSLAYNMFALGGGADFSLRRSVNLRADAEYQYWATDKADFPTGLSPLVFSVGAAYHFH